LAQQERAVRTRKAILQAAARVFDQRGYAAATMSEILEQAQVTKGALYFHFPTKEALAGAIMAEQQRFAESRWPEKSPLQQAINLTQHVARLLQHDYVLRAAIRLVIEQGSFAVPNPAAYALWIQRLRAFLDEAREAGELRPGADVAAAAETVVGAFTGIQLMDQVLTDRHDLPAKIANLWRLVLPGLAAADRIPDLVLDEESQAA
jgi:AcrR family transcriptional regulator